MQTVKAFYARSNYENKPASHISWFGAETYCLEIGKRLPTESEWEKAGRGDIGGKYPWGNDEPDSNMAVFGQASFLSLKDVNSLPEGMSSYGAHHMAGNVWEWVADWYDANYYKKWVVENPKGPSVGTSRILRGASWYYNAVYLRTSLRHYSPPGNQLEGIGFRCAIEDSESPSFMDKIAEAFSSFKRKILSWKHLFR